MDFASEEIARLRAAVGRISRSVDRQVTDDGLSPTQLIVLGAVARAGSIGIGELADLEVINPTMLSRILGKLQNAGLLERRADASDGRAVRVEITAAGRRRHKNRQLQRSKVFAAHIADLPPDTVESLRSALPALESLADHLIATHLHATRTERPR